MADQSELLRGSTVLLDGFTGFTPIQQKFLRELMKLAGKITVTLTIDAGENPWKVGGVHELFYLSKKTIHMVTGLAKETQMELVTPVILGKDGAPRFRNSEALAFLERHFSAP